MIEDRSASTSASALLDRLDEAVPRLAETLAQQVHAQVPAYRAMGQGPLVAAVHATLKVMLQVTSADTALSPALTETLRQLGQAREEQGIPLTGVLRGWHLGIDGLVAQARAITAADERGDRIALDFAQRLMTVVTSCTAIVADGHREAELHRVRTDQERLGQLVRRVLRGDQAEFTAARDRGDHGMDPQAPVRAVAARPADAARRCLLHAAGGRTLLAIIDGQLVGVVTATCTFTDAATVTIGVGTMVKAVQLPTSYHLARRALQTAERFGLIGAHTFADLGVLPAIASEPEIGELFTARYIQPVLSGARAGADLLATVQTYLQKGQRIEDTAEELILHPNTVRYRLARFAELTGASLTDTDDLVEVWWALRAHAAGAGSDRAKASDDR